MADILNIPGLGRLEIVEIYDYYDQPILFSCKNAAGHLYLVVAADENDQHEIWLYAGVSTERLNLVRSGAIDLHDAFAKPEGGFLLQATVPYEDQIPLRIEPIQPNPISEDMLPTTGERLDLKTDTLPVLSNSEEVAISRKQEILNLTLNFDGFFRTETPVAIVGKILERFQNVINAIGMICVQSDRINEDVKSKMQISLLGVGPGSFDLRLASTKTVDLLNHSDFGDAIAEFLALLKAGSDHDQLKGILGQLRSKVATDYTKFLKLLSESVKDAKFTWASPDSDRGGTAYLSELQMRDVVEILQKFQEEATPKFTITGTLTGAFLRSKRFEIETTDKTYTGVIAKEAIKTVENATLSQTYTATIQEITKRSETTAEITKTEYQLLSLE